MFYFDSTYLIIIPAIIFSLFAQIRVNSTFKKYQKVNNSKGLTGAETARKILDSNGLGHIRVEHVSGHLTDHYSPNENVIRLSESVYNSTSAAAVGVAAHEAGHALQHSEGYFPIKLRNAIIPVTQFGSSLSMPLVLLGILFSFQPLVTVGIFLFTAVVAFQAITLPVEFNASNRAVRILDEYSVLDGGELASCKKVLNAAALTYVAALFSSLMSLIRLIAISNRNKR